MNRRDILRGLALAALGAALPAPAPAQPSEGPVKRLITVMLRGGLDALGALPPVDDPRLYLLRPSIALPPPGIEDGALPLVPPFGLHPALAPLLEPWSQGALALATACGLPATVRAHPDAQRAMESGVPQERNPRDGWMGRLLPLLGPAARMLSLAPRPSLTVQGKQGVVNIAPTGYPLPAWRLERPDIYAAYDQLYRGPDPLGRVYRQAQAVLRNRVLELDREIRLSSADATSVHALPDLAGKIVQYLEKNPATRLVYLAVGGFDTHIGQGAGKGRLAEALYSLGRGLTALAKALGPGLSDTVVLAFSEFGRSVAENEYGGTDNGHGGLAMILGGPTAGGKVYGPWPGLEPDKLSGGKDLAVAVDYREIIAAVVLNHFDLGPDGLAKVLPGYFPARTVEGLIRKA